MKIKKELPQFQKASAVLMVLGGKEGVFYHASEGVIEKVGICAVENPKYSDNEGFFRTRGRGGASTSGSVKEIDKQHLEKSFAKECGSTLKKLEKDHPVDEVYLLVPSRLKNLVNEALPPHLQKKIVKVKTGNHHEKHPFEILELLQVKK